MRHFQLSLLLVALACTGSPAIAGSDSAGGAAADAKKKKGEKVVCRTEEVVGSRRPKRICMSQAQWSEIRQDTQESLRDMRARNGSQQPQ